MTKKSKPDKNTLVHDCWMKGMRPETTAQYLQLSYKYVKIRYADFIFFAEKLKGNNKEERIIQIRAIESGIVNIWLYAFESAIGNVFFVICKKLL